MSKRTINERKKKVLTEAKNLERKKERKKEV